MYLILFIKKIFKKLEKLEDMMKYLIHSLTSIMDTDDKISIVNDSLIKNIIFFSLLLMLIIIISGFIETIYLKKYFKQRKLI